MGKKRKGLQGIKHQNTEIRLGIENNKLIGWLVPLLQYDWLIVRSHDQPVGFV